MELRHPDKENVSASYGWDWAIGFFVVVSEDGYAVVEYDKLQPGKNTLDGAMRLLAEHGFFTVDDYEKGLERSQYQEAREMPDALRIPAEVVLAMKRAAEGPLPATAAQVEEDPP